MTRYENVHVVFITSAIRTRTKHVYGTKCQVSVEMDDGLTVHNRGRREDGKSDFIRKFANEPRKTFVLFYIEKEDCIEVVHLVANKKCNYDSVKFVARKVFDRTERYVYTCSEKNCGVGKRKKSNKYEIRSKISHFKITNVCDRLDFRNRRHIGEYQKKKKILYKRKTIQN